jgi:hypothetical protein
MLREYIISKNLNIFSNIHDNSHVMHNHSKQIGTLLIVGVLRIE